MEEDRKYDEKQAYEMALARVRARNQEAGITMSVKELVLAARKEMDAEKKRLGLKPSADS